MLRTFILSLLLFLGCSFSSRGSEPFFLTNYFKAETRDLADRCLSGIHSLDAWTQSQPRLRTELFEMLSLDPLPDRTDLKPVITGKLETNGFTVEKLHFQSMPGLFVTGNLYLPKNITKPVPAILYVCGHASVKEGKVSYGNKTAYQHHGAWFARNGYACLILDTVQLGEIEGVHHGTYREGMWWWNSRGYTPAGVEAWNCIRALDYLETRPEIDPARFGVTGRSGGGAYSWWVAALDERIKVAAPVAGITDLQNHVVDGVVEGHCDCMFMVNTYRWDYPLVAALVAPRPLLIANSDKDTIFPLDGVVRLHSKVAKIYDLYGAKKNLGLLITEGPHEDTQDLQLPVFRWFNRFLKQEDPIIEMAATRFFPKEELKVFADLPAVERTSIIHDSFVPMAKISAIESEKAWTEQRDQMRHLLQTKSFAGWPENPLPAAPELTQEIALGERTFQVFQFFTHPELSLDFYVLGKKEEPLTRGNVYILDESSWGLFVASAPEEVRNILPSVNAAGDARKTGDANFWKTNPGEATIFLIPRGVGPTALPKDKFKRTQILRRYMLLGQTLDSMQVWDIKRALEAALKSTPVSIDTLHLHAKGQMAVNVLYAAIFTGNFGSLQLEQLPATHMEGPDYLNVLRFMDVPQAIAMALEFGNIHLSATEKRSWHFAQKISSLADLKHELTVSE
ncbi:MAG: alpha/beta hydrolase family protein [Verrucomicrobiales bacterium]